MRIFEHALALLTEELALDPVDFWRTRSTPQEEPSDSDRPTVDYGLLSVVFKGRTCFLGNTLAFRLFARLVRTPNVFVAYDDLLTDVWGSIRTDCAIRSVVKRLRARLRKAGMGGLADAIDGSETGRYALRLNHLT
jgi:DNA-binding response OmpR family regulator